MDGLLSNERELLARMIQAEAGNQGELGMRAVGAVIDNRRRAQGYGGSTFRDVLLAPGQFSPANSITGYAGGEQGVDLNRLQPSETAYSVADAIMSGQYEDPTSGALNFLNPDISQPSWLSSMQNTVKIGDHLFGTAGSGEGVAGRPGGTQMARQPQGLLGTPIVSTQGQAQQPQEELPFFRRPGVGNFFDTLAMGLEGMTLNPNRALMQAAQNRIQARREAGQTAAQRNRTADWLESQGMTAAAEGVRSGAISARDALALARGGEATAAQRNYEFLISQGMSPEQAMERAFGGGVTVNTGAQGPQVGTIPQGYQMVQDAETGAYRMEPIPGGPAAAEAESEVEAAQKRQEQAGRAAGVVLEDINALQEKLRSSSLPITGALGSLIRNIPGTDAYDASAMIQTIAGNIGFDRLQQMREASPTGGALGAVSERELSTLQSVLGSLDQAQSQAQFERNLSRLEDIYMEIMRKASAYPNAADFGFGGQAPSSGGTNRIRYDAQGNRIQ